MYFHEEHRSNKVNTKNVGKTSPDVHSILDNFEDEAKARDNTQTKGDTMTNQNDKQWATVVDGKLINTHGREKGSMADARIRAREYGWGARAVLLSQSRIDALD